MLLCFYFVVSSILTGYSSAETVCQTKTNLVNINSKIDKCEKKKKKIAKSYLFKLNYLFYFFPEIKLQIQGKAIYFKLTALILVSFNTIFLNHVNIACYMIFDDWCTSGVTEEERLYG